MPAAAVAAYAEASHDAPATPTDKSRAKSAAIEGGDGEETARRCLRRKGGWVEWRRGRAGVKRGAWLRGESNRRHNNGRGSRVRQWGMMQHELN